ncbi:MAG: hypothetical protein DIZ77_01750 [endosymbiont of Seepiophila jonesi]|uniref:Uncharacterized protein n=1 Tax=endosymbiont of Lamellibrachia luymesi TaxID=2200907 RepID=A0A370DVW5_9GAMM|nr:MAG: hypothetical protein DIZ79_14100 [endosymbiont of Lamellibrachia luymesi]RDH94313.1 MAG: hypothetical protein DIZ77_01750 [endosymbiont of Seepiophila jonesi]
MEWEITDAPAREIELPIPRWIELCALPLGMQVELQVVTSGQSLCQLLPHRITLGLAGGLPLHGDKLQRLHKQSQGHTTGFGNGQDTIRRLQHARPGLSGAIAEDLVVYCEYQLCRLIHRIAWIDPRTGPDYQVNSQLKRSPGSA